jgi:hypothetical protein
VVNEIKWDHTKVKEDADGNQKASAETDGQTTKEK